MFRGAPYVHKGEADVAFRAESANVSNWRTRSLAEVEVPYTRSQRPPGDDPDNPVDRPLRIGPVDLKQIEEFVFLDENDKPFQNKAGFPIAPFMIRQRLIPVVTIEVAKPDFLWERVGDVSGKWNSEKWKDQPKRSVRVTITTSGEQWREDRRFWWYRLKFELYGKEQFLEFPNAGLIAVFEDDITPDKTGGFVFGHVELNAVEVAKNGSTPKLSDNFGGEVSQPVLLDKFGRVAHQGTEDAERILKFFIDQEFDFNKL